MFIIIEEKTLLEQQSHNRTTSAVGNGVCYVCSSDSLITDHESGKVVYSKCGLVISDKIQESRGLYLYCNRHNKCQEQHRICDVS
jgi:hypothetical protein